MIERCRVRTVPNISLREALADPQLLGHALADDSWLLWRVLLIAAWPKL